MKLSWPDADYQSPNMLIPATLVGLQKDGVRPREVVLNYDDIRQLLDMHVCEMIPYLLHIKATLERP